MYTQINEPRFLLLLLRSLYLKERRRLEVKFVLSLEVEYSSGGQKDKDI